MDAINIINLADFPNRARKRASGSKYDHLFDALDQLPRGMAVEIPNPTALTIGVIRTYFSRLSMRRGVKVTINQINGRVYLSKRPA